MADVSPCYSKLVKNIRYTSLAALQSNGVYLKNFLKVVVTLMVNKRVGSLLALELGQSKHHHSTLFICMIAL